MKDTKTKATTKASRKTSATHIETSVIETLKAIAAKFGHDSKSLSKKIEKEAKKLAKKLSKEFTVLKTAAADEAHTLIKKIESPAKEKPQVKTAKKAIAIAEPVVKPVKTPKTTSNSEPVVKSVKNIKVAPAAEPIVQPAKTAKIPAENKAPKTSK